MAEFNIGDIVQLKSGGPKMTVTSIGSKNESVYTAWFAGSKKEIGTFPVQALVPISDEQPK